MKGQHSNIHSQYKIGPTKLPYIIQPNHKSFFIEFHISEPVEEETSLQVISEMHIYNVVIEESQRS